MITLDRLRYFIAAARYEHVGRAASTLHTSPSVVSNAIKDLEASVRFALFYREKNRIKITPSGRVFLEKAQKVLAQVASLTDSNIIDSPSLSGHYKIGASHFLMQSLLVPAFLKLQKEHPQLTAEFVSLDSGLALLQVRAGSLDGGLIFRSSYFEKIDERIVHEGYFDVFLKKKHPLSKKTRKLQISELNQMPAISFRTNSGANFWESHSAFSNLGIVPSHQYFYDDTATALQLLQQVNGWAFLPNFIGSDTGQITALGLTDRTTAPVNISLVLNSGTKSSLFFESLEQGIRDILKSKGFDPKK